MMQKRARQDLAIAERMRLRAEINQLNETIGQLRFELVAQRRKTAEAEGRAKSFWGLFTETSNKYHRLAGHVK